MGSCLGRSRPLSWLFAPAAAVVFARYFLLLPLGCAMLCLLKFPLQNGSAHTSVSSLPLSSDRGKVSRERTHHRFLFPRTSVLSRRRFSVMDFLQVLRGQVPPNLDRRSTAGSRRRGGQALVLFRLSLAASAQLGLAPRVQPLPPLLCWACAPRRPHEDVRLPGRSRDERGRSIHLSRLCARPATPLRLFSPLAIVLFLLTMVGLRVVQVHVFRREGPLLRKESEPGNRRDMVRSVQGLRRLQLGQPRRDNCVGLVLADLLLGVA